MRRPTHDRQRERQAAREGEEAGSPGPWGRRRSPIRAPSKAFRDQHTQETDRILYLFYSSVGLLPSWRSPPVS